MDVNLPPDLHQYLSDQVSRGVFPSIDDAVTQAVVVLREQESELELRRAELLRKIDVGIEQLDRGECVVVPREKLGEFFEEIKREGREELARRRGLAK